MKVFWAILLGSFMVASAIVFSRADESGPVTPAPVTPPAQPMNQPSRDAEAVPTDAVDSATEEPSDTAPSSPDQADTGPEVTENAPLDLDELLGIEEEPNRITAEMAIEDAAANPQGPRTISQMSVAEFAELALQASGSVEEASEVANSITPNAEVQTSEDTLVIGRVTIPGSGTEADPYDLPWGVLISAIRTYNPRLELTELPAWAEALNDKPVRLTGFAFLPVVASETDEMLLMLNLWDGCHLGAPPPPYDSVEVLLDDARSFAVHAEAAGGRNGFVTITGRFNVDPFLVRGWLVSLYTMDDAELEFAGS